MATSEQETTQVLGYFNGNRWPIQLVISRFNCTLHLKPGEFVLDRKGRKINDPFFEAYANTKQLKREVADKQVPIIRVPLAANTPPTVPASQCDGQAVRSVTEWKVDVKGHRQPVIPEPKALPPQAVNKPSVKPMSMEQARAAGFIGKQRIVPEDYGATDTEGMPPSNPPPIKVSLDSTMNKGVKPLPQELLAEAPADRAPMVQSLQAAASVEVESGGFMNAVTQHAPPTVPIQAGRAPAAVPPPSETPLPQPALKEAVPEPPLEEMEPESEPVPRLPQKQAVIPPQAPRPVTPRDRYVCIACGKPFQFRSQLVNHAKTTAGHAQMLDAIMAPYPEPRTP